MKIIKYISPKAEIQNVIFEGSSIILGPTKIYSKTLIGNNSIIGYPRRSSLKKLIMEKGGSWKNYDEKSEGSVIGEDSIIRSNSIIYEKVNIGRNFEGGHNILIREETNIGCYVKVGSNTIIDGNVTIGNNVNIQTSVYIPPKCIIEEDVFIAPRVCFTNDKYPPSKRLEGVIIRRGTVIGANAILISGITIGERAVIAAGAVVTVNVPNDVVVAGVPAKIISTREKFDEKRELWERELI